MRPGSGTECVHSQQMQLHLDAEHFQLDIVIETFTPESHGVTCEGDAVDAPRADVACEVQ